MLSKQKEQILNKYDKNIIWNISAFGNILLMDVLDVIRVTLENFGYKNPFSVIHGSYSCKYNGGRQAICTDSKTNIENKIKHFNDLGIGIKLTFSNSNVHKEQFEEDEMRWYLDVLNEHKGIGNGIICVNDDFAELVKKNYPDLDLVASHVKMEMETKMGITDTVDYYNSKFDLYDIVVMNNYRAFDDIFLSQITHPEKVEFIVNHSCTTNCQFGKYHHSLVDRLTELSVKNNNNPKQIIKDIEYINNKKEIDKLMIQCQKIKLKHNLDLVKYQSLNREEINYLANKFNITRFKIEGRDMALYKLINALSKTIINNDSLYESLEIYFRNPATYNGSKLLGSV